MSKACLRARRGLTHNHVGSYLDLRGQRSGNPHSPYRCFRRERGDAVNLLTLGGGDFMFRQLLAGDGITAESSGSLVRAGASSFRWASEATGDVKLTMIESIGPVEVIVIPDGPGRLVETIEWTLVDSGAVRRFQAARHFTFPRGRELPSLQLRSVSLTNAVSDRQVDLSIHSEIRSFPRRGSASAETGVKRSI